MKRILALIMVLAMVFAFAACKSKDDGATTTDPSSAGGEVIDNGEGSTPVDASAADSTEAGSNDASEVSTDASGKPVEAPSQAAGSQGGSHGGKTPAAAKTVAEIVADYVKARKATKPAPAGKQTMALGNNGKITGDGGLGGLLKVASPIINNVLKKTPPTQTMFPLPATPISRRATSSPLRLSSPQTVSTPTTSSMSRIRLTAPTVTPTTAVLLLAASEPSAASMRLSTSSAQSSRAAKKMLSSPTPTLTSSLA